MQDRAQSGLGFGSVFELGGGYQPGSERLAPDTGQQEIRLGSAPEQRHGRPWCPLSQQILAD